MTERDAALGAARERDRIELLSYGIVATGLPIIGTPAAVQAVWLVLLAAVEMVSRRYTHGGSEPASPE